MSEETPNFIYIGPDKAGSTWLFRLLNWHPETYVTPSKDTQFFGKYYGKGIKWYKNRFRPSDKHKVVSEVGHNYLYSENVAQRIKAHLGKINLMVTLREPTSRAFSAYLYLLKHDLYKGTFKQAIEDVDEIREHGLYLKYLRPYLKLFGRDNIYIAVFDNLKKNPNTFANSLFKFLNIAEHDLPGELTEKALPAAKARSRWMAYGVKRLAWLARELGLSDLVGKIKTSKVIHRILYKKYNSKPSPDSEVISVLRKYYRHEVRKLDDEFNLNLMSRWGYR